MSQCIFNDNHVETVIMKEDNYAFYIPFATVVLFASCLVWALFL